MTSLVKKSAPMVACIRHTMDDDSSRKYHTRTPVRVYVYVYACVHVYVYVYMHVYVYMRTPDALG